MTQPPTLSIITVCYNAELLIERTIQSVIDQNWPFIEYIIIDGGSTDQTLEIIKRYSSHIRVMISEQDHGIYDAMNKGLTHATGKFILFLNAGDTIASPDTVSMVMQKASENPNVTLFFGDTLHVMDSGNRYWNERRENFLDFILLGPICHQSLYARRDLLENAGFDTSYRICADYNWFLKILFSRESTIVYIPEVLSFYLIGGFSAKNYKLYRKEQGSIMIRYTMRAFFSNHFPQTTRSLFSRNLPHYAWNFLESLRGVMGFC